MRANTFLALVGDSRYSTRWTPTRYSWDELVERLSTPVVTGETMAEYDSLTRAAQGNLKDVGGYVPGEYRGEQRRRDELVSKDLVVLDADHADELFPGRVRRHLACRWALHTTRSDRPGGRRYRLVIALSHAITPEQYGAVSRWLARQVGMEVWDDTTYDPNRFMYWPSVSSDQAFEFERCDEEPFRPEVALDTYTDWRDMSLWPTSTREGTLVRSTGESAGDPRDKPGMVGAFCRSFDIHEVMARWLGGHYERHSETRYTYLAGSTSGGAVVYGDEGEALWLYSHHDTDPIHRRLVNSWDLLRLHRYGELDAEAPADTPVQELPSHSAMVDWAKGLPEVRVELVRAQEAASVAARDAFLTVGDVPCEDEPESEPGVDWRSLLIVTERGIGARVHNLILLLAHAETIPWRLVYNAWSGEYGWADRPPWRRTRESPRRGLYPLRDVDITEVRARMELLLSASPAQQTVYEAMKAQAERHAINPRRDWLDGLVWDGTPRIERLFIDYLGAEDTEYVRTVARTVMVAIVARTYEPGCKWDYVPLCIGPQGIGKSTLPRVLAGAGYFTDSPPPLNDRKAAGELMRGISIYELAELNATRRAAVEAVKAFLTTEVERYRESYGRVAEEFPRTCVFWGTSNDGAPLSDPTGNRRFWPVRVPGHPVLRVSEWAPMLERNREQLYAEAVVLYRLGHPLEMTAEVEATATQAQAEATSDDGLTGRIEAWLESPVPEGWSEWSTAKRTQFYESRYELRGPMTRRDRVCVREVWVELLGGSESRVDWHQARRISASLDTLCEGSEARWERAALVRHAVYGRQRGWVRVASNDAIDVTDGVTDASTHKDGLQDR